MSAYIVEDKTINRIVNRVVLEVRNNPESHTLQKKLSNLGYDISDQSFADKLAKDMFELNVSAVRQRYNDKEERTTFPSPFIHLLSWHPLIVKYLQ